MLPCGVEVVAMGWRFALVFAAENGVVGGCSPNWTHVRGNGPAPAAISTPEGSRRRLFVECRACIRVQRRRFLDRRPKAIGTGGAIHGESTEGASLRPGRPISVGGLDSDLGPSRSRIEGLRQAARLKTIGRWGAWCSKPHRRDSASGWRKQVGGTIKRSDDGDPSRPAGKFCRRVRLGKSFFPL